MASPPPEVQAWQRFCRRIEALGERILAEDFPHEPADTTQGIAHLAQQVSCWLGWSLGHADTTAPFFHRSGSLLSSSACSGWRASSSRPLAMMLAVLAPEPKIVEKSVTSSPSESCPCSSRAWTRWVKRSSRGASRRRA